MLPDTRRLVEQVEELAEGRIERNARIAELEAALKAITDLLGDSGLPARWPTDPDRQFKIAASLNLDAYKAYQIARKALIDERN